MAPWPDPLLQKYRVVQLNFKNSLQTNMHLKILGEIVTAEKIPFRLGLCHFICEKNGVEALGAFTVITPIYIELPRFIEHQQPFSVGVCSLRSFYKGHSYKKIGGWKCRKHEEFSTDCPKAELRIFGLKFY